MINIKMLALMMMVVLIACKATSIKKELIFNSLTFDNQSGSVLNDVKISVDKTGAFVSCGLVYKGPSCSTSFPAKVYQGNSVQISWQIKGVAYSVGPIYVEPPILIDSNTPANIIIKFGLESEITTKFSYEQ
jgi:hypothetical protein